MPDLETLLRDVKPAPDPAWTLKLDTRVAHRFPGPPPRWKRPFIAVRDHLLRHLCRARRRECDGRDRHRRALAAPAAAMTRRTSGGCSAAVEAMPGAVAGTRLVRRTRPARQSIAPTAAAPESLRSSRTAP